MLTARGERSKFLGREGQSSAQLDNVQSDLFFRWLNNEDAVEAFWVAQPQPVQDLIAGYASGFNRYIQHTPAGNLPEACRNAAWLRPLDERDLVRLYRRLLVEGGVGRFAEALLAASPPEAPPAFSSSATAVGLSLARLKGFALERGSNAIAVGGRRTENGKGLLLANPHFPWSGSMRFYQMHLTIPGKLDVMGAALPGLPVVNIGFNQHLAWTHTVDTSSHFTLHRLQLDPKDARRYLVDGRSLPLRKTSVPIEVRETDGHLSRLNHDVYESQFGPIVNWPGVLPWDRQSAYALQDANLANTRVLQQWYAMNQAPSLEDFRAAIQKIQGIPWVNTLAVDDRGQALYMNLSVVPNLPAEQLAACADQALLAKGLPGLDGTRSDCNWRAEPGVVQPGIVSSERMPTLQREDFVQNSNDSAWLSNPAEPLSGYSPLISREGSPLGDRARFALSQIETLGNLPISEAFLQDLVTDNRVYAADLVMDDLLAFCRSRSDLEAIAQSCAALAAWDRSAGLDAGIGFLYFQHFMHEFQKAPAWSHPFDPLDPLHTPRGIAWQKPEVAKQLELLLRNAQGRVSAAGVSSHVKWGRLQIAKRGNRLIPIPGGDGHLGIYNAIQSKPAGNGRLEVVGGSSYIQLVSFDADGPKAKGLLSFSQSTDPASPHFKDQTELFSKQQWPQLPFTEKQITADPDLRILRLSE